MKTILLPTDFTESGTTALAWAKLFARQYGASLILVHIQQIPLPDTAVLSTAGDFGMNALSTGPVIDLEQIDRERLTKMALDIQAEGFNCTTELRWGPVADTITTTADELHADLIVIGRGHLDTFFERLLGTEATGVARKAHCPVLVVPMGEGIPVRLHTMLFSTNLEFDQPTEFGEAVAIARTFEAVLSVVHVHAENQPSMSDTPQMLAQLQQIYGESPLPVETVTARTVTGGMETYLETHRPDLLVMINRERDFLTGLLNPSLTNHMVVITHVPILIYHAQGDL